MASTVEMSLLLYIIGYLATFVTSLPVSEILTIESPKQENEIDIQIENDKESNNKNKHLIEVIIEESVPVTESDPFYDDVDDDRARSELEEETFGSVRIFTAPRDCPSCYQEDMAGICRPKFGCNEGALWYHHQRRRNGKRQQPAIKPMGMIGMKQMLSLMGLEKPPKT